MNPLLRVTLQGELSSSENEDSNYISQDLSLQPQFASTESESRQERFRFSNSKWSRQLNDISRICDLLATFFRPSFVRTGGLTAGYRHTTHETRRHTRRDIVDVLPFGTNKANHAMERRSNQSLAGVTRGNVLRLHTPVRDTSCLYTTLGLFRQKDLKKVYISDAQGNSNLHHCACGTGIYLR